MRKLATLLFVTALVFNACGEEQKVGSDKILDIKEKEGQLRLGEELEVEEGNSEGPAAISIEVTPPPQVTAPPTPPPTYFEVKLIPDSPFFSANGEPSNRMVMRKGAILRVQNIDKTPERECRSFTLKGTGLSSGCMTPNEDPWEIQIGKAGSYRIEDEGLVFATATLEVVG